MRKNPPFLHNYNDRHGKPRCEFRRKGFKTVPLPPIGSPGHAAAYAAALAGETVPKIEIGASRTKAGTVAAAVALYFGSISFGNLGPGTKRVRRRILERFREAHGDKSFAGLQRKHIEAMVAEKTGTPHAARHFVNALRAVIEVGIAHHLRSDDPTFGMPRVKAKPSEGFVTWSEDAIGKFEKKFPLNSRARLAFGLLLFTAQRRGDVVHMGRQHVRDGFLRVQQEKTGAILEIPILPELQKILAAHPAEHLTFLTTQAGEPFTPAGFTNWFRDRCGEAGLPAGLSAHGLRKAACRRLAEAGCTVHQIAAISGHASLKEVQRYTKAADQKRMATEAMRMMSGTKGGEQSGEPPQKVSQNKPQAIENKG